ncbi:MAG: hypothetical protein U9N76_02200 [Candidatus Marinimicrobia bacterium]|nr:hypothetical protein [Candidatus Neomarinimicrobiota bacterium]
MKKIILILLVFTTLGFAQDAEYYINRLNSEMAKVNDLKVKMRIRSRLPGMTVPDRNTKLFFKRPDKIHIADKKSLFIPREALLLDLSYLVDSTCTTKLMKTNFKNTDPFIAIEILKPYEDRKVKFVAIIDTVKWAFHQIGIDDMPQMNAKVDFVQMKVNDTVWLPKDIKVMMESKELEKKNVKNPRRRHSQKNKSNYGYAYIKFSEYEINIGLDDSVFDK